MRLRELIGEQVTSTTPTQPGAGVSKPVTPATANMTPNALPSNPAVIAAAKKAAQERLKAARDEVAAAQQRVAAAQQEVNKPNLPMATLPEEKLNEYSEDPADDLTTLLRNLLGRADQESEPSTMSFKALSSLLNNIDGATLDQDSFEKLVNTNPDLNNYVSDISSDGVELSTRYENPPKEDPKTPMRNPIDGGPSVDQMASSAAKKHLKDIGK